MIVMRARARRNVPLFIAALLLAAAALAFGPCATGKRGAAPLGRPLADGESIGKIDPTSNSTAISMRVHVLIAVECRNEHLYIRTSVENLDARMRCTDLQPPAAFQPYSSEQVSITYNAGQVIIENNTIGKIAIRATDPRVTEVNVTPGP